MLLQGLGAGGPIIPLLPIAFVLRLAALRFDLHVPPFSPKDGHG